MLRHHSRLYLKSTETEQEEEIASLLQAANIRFIGQGEVFTEDVIKRHHQA